jgi:hypothetical protein
MELDIIFEKEREKKERDLNPISTFHDRSTDHKTIIGPGGR